MTELTELTSILKESSLRISEAVSEQNQVIFYHLFQIQYLHTVYICYSICSLESQYDTNSCVLQ